MAWYAGGMNRGSVSAGNDGDMGTLEGFGVVAEYEGDAVLAEA